MNLFRFSISRTLHQSFTYAAVLILGLGYSTLRAADTEFQLKDNDVWVMAGDSITAQRLHTNYIEAFYRTRHPEWHLHFRNSGIGGNRTGNILARFDYDVAAWKPTIVSIELGMNDVNGSQDDYIKGMKQLIAKIRAIPAQPVLISSSPVDDGSLLNDWKSPRCEKLHPFTEALQALAAEEHVVFVDQYHALIGLWAQNRRKGEELARKNGTWPPKPAPATPVPASTPAPAAGPTPVPVPKPTPIAPSLIPFGGDAVHPGPVGQYSMAAVILEGLKADGAVSTATLKAEGKVADQQHCKITDVTMKNGKLSFTRLDDRSPWPIQTGAKRTLELRPETLKLSQYLLRVTGLADGQYRVTINGQPAATVSAADLAAGWNIASVFEGALGARADQIVALINKLQSPLNNDWRAASKAKDAEKLAAAQTAIDSAEAELQATIQPLPLHFELER